MKVAELLEQRRANWRELEELCRLMEHRTKRALGPAKVLRFVALYRGACADLALADAYQLPPNTVRYLHQLVGRAHNQLYPSRGFQVRRWGEELLFELPQRLFRDGCLRLAFLLFWGVFGLTALLAGSRRDLAEALLGDEQMQLMEQMYEKPPESQSVNERAFMLGFYIRHNPSIGLQCFASGLLLGIGGLPTLISNAAVLGATFGYMATVPQRDNFYTFVTAHGPFELTAVVLAAAAGMRMGFSLIQTNGWTRLASLRRSMHEAVPMVSLAVLLFGLAAFIEAFISPAPIPYAAKAAVAVISSGMLLFYFVLLGQPRGESHAAR
jgi:uncharacterized membrane protein SpoIIM required for sporulation